MTPVDALQECCAKQGFTSPKYEFIEEDKTDDKTFYCQVTIEEIGESMRGVGRSQQEAMQNATTNLIEYLKEIHHIDNIPQLNNLLDNIPIKDAVETLRDLCLQNGHPSPQFEIIKNSVPPEAPEFTVRCIVASIERFGSASTKLAAKQQAARHIIDVITAIHKEKHQQQVISFVNASVIEDEIKMYQQFIESDIEIEQLMDRHNYFKNLNPELLKTAKKILYNETDYKSAHDQVDDFLKALHIKYSTKIVPSNGIESLKFIELLINDFDCCFSGTDNIYSEMLSYFKDML